MRKKKTCRKKVLAQKGNFKIEGCNCGVAHLEIGPMSLRFQYGALEDLAEVLETAVNNIKNPVIEEKSEDIQNTTFFGNVDQCSKLAN